jgi:polyhydroxyalkanoate synthesis regulator phasin
MKTKNTAIIICVLATAIIISGLAFAGDWGNRGRRGAGFHRPHGDLALSLIVKYQQKNLMVQTLSDISGQSIEAIQTKLKDQRMGTIMRELNVDRQAFHTAMRIKSIELIQKSAESGTITPEQAKEIIEKMKNRSQRRELMSQLIEKGVKDGTITTAQAQMLMGKSR